MVFFFKVNVHDFVHIHVHYMILNFEMFLIPSFLILLFFVSDSFCNNLSDANNIFLYL